MSPPDPWKLVKMTFTASDDKSDWSGVALLAASGASNTLKPDTVNSQLKRVPFHPNSIAMPTLMPFRETYRWCGVRRIYMTTYSYFFRNRRQPKVGYTKLRLQAGLTYG
jgi:hypothetical protein